MSTAGDDRGLEGFSFPGPTQIASSAASLAAPQSRAKVPQAPQYSQMAWMALGRKRDLTGLNGARPGKLTMEEVKRHSSEEVRWASDCFTRREYAGVVHSQLHPLDAH